MPQQCFQAFCIFFLFLFYFSVFCFSVLIITQVEIWVEHKVLRAPPQAIRAQNWYILRWVRHIKLARQAPPFFQDFCMKTANMPKLLPLSASAWNAVVDSFKCFCSYCSCSCLLICQTAQVLHIIITCIVFTTSPCLGYSLRAFTSDLMPLVLCQIQKQIWIRKQQLDADILRKPKPTLTNGI